MECWEKREETRIGQLAKKKWFIGGDRNSKFFRVVVNTHHHQSHIATMQLVDGTVLATLKEVHDSAIQYFHKFLSDANQRACLNLSHLILKVFSEEENTKFMACLQN